MKLANSRLVFVASAAGIVMGYVPTDSVHADLGEVAPTDALSITRRSIVRRLRATDFTTRHTHGILHIMVAQLAQPLAIATNFLMSFGGESIKAIEYFRRVIERNDLIDAILLPPTNGFLPIASYWIHIEYDGSLKQAGYFSKKDDGLFAMRAKAGEKAERIVTRILRDEFGHRYPDEMCESPGYFEIRYAGKKVRRPDRKCVNCGLTVEIKKRNKDAHLRVSHSNGRPFAAENSNEGWHAFVFQDMKPRFVPNLAIAQAIANGKFTSGQDRYDSWADVDALIPAAPPRCSTS